MLVEHPSQVVAGWPGHPHHEVTLGRGRFGVSAWVLVYICPALREKKMLELIASSSSSSSSYLSKLTEEQKNTDIWWPLYHTADPFLFSVFLF